MEPKSPGIEWVFSEKPMTAWGGLRVVEEMLRRMGVREALDRCGLPQPGSNRGYDPQELLLSFLVTVWTGGTRFSHTAAVRFDEVLRVMFGWRRVASVSTFCRFFGKFRQKESDAVFGSLGRWLWERLAAQTVTVDLDSTVLQHDGETLEGSARGYNPRRPGRRSHHPLMAFVADLRLVLHTWLRPGNTAAAGANVLAFLQEAFALLGERHRVGLVRADSGFFGDRLFTWLEERGVDYVVAARLTTALKQHLGAVKVWVELAPGVAVSETSWQAHGWKAARRLVLVRQELSRHPKAAGKLLLECPGYRFSVLATSLRLAPAEVWRLYRGRADSENRIRELKADFGLEGFALRSFWGTEAAFRAVCLAYNLMALFRQLTLKTQRQKTLATLRFECFAIGASLGQSGRKKLLRLSLPHQKRAWFAGLFSNLHDLHPPWNLHIPFS